MVGSPNAVGQSSLLRHPHGYIKWLSVTGSASFIRHDSLVQVLHRHPRLGGQQVLPQTRADGSDALYLGERVEEQR